MALTVADITTDHRAYAEHRPDLRRQMIPVRAERRVRVGDLVVAEFENEQTLRYQVQEMVYTERLTASADVAHEIEAYSRLLPDSHVLTATIFIELAVLETVRDELSRLAGLQHSVSLEIGGQRSAGVEIPGLDEDPDVPSETVSVHMVRFTLSDELRDAFRDPAVPAELVIDHPAYGDGTPLVAATRRALIADLALRS
ncbi:DUF3501 family protein [Frankia sp. AgB32]|uniref:DUF3501 family protein n=1 Tax=Frankia sp. AgB32 TaxID=631119 RepID=UPI00200EA575|nr:DUF3501 family protein [Frankia sp. AgB32]MCK9894041.1 DUF3501 family protein [Frankia sp. AgB32]